MNAQVSAWPHLHPAPETGEHWHRTLIFRDSTAFRLDALLEAARATEARPSRDISTRRSHIQGLEGRITVQDLGSGWARLVEADLDGCHDAFWARLKRLTDKDPSAMRELPDPGELEGLPGDAQVQGAPPRVNRLLGILTGTARQDHTVLGLDPEDDTASLPTVEDGAIMAAARETMGRDPEVRRTSDPTEYRLWHLDWEEGTVTFWDAGNGWATVTEVDLPEDAARRLRERVRLAQDPDYRE